MRPEVQWLSAALERFTPDPADSKAIESKGVILAYLHEVDDPFSESADPTHVTASAVVVSELGVLLHKHKRFDIWVGPGGHIDGGESAPEAALRETLEETGLTAIHDNDEPTLIHLDVHEGPKGHTHLDTRWLLRTPADEPRPPAGESQEVYWLSFDDALQRVPADFRGALRKAQIIIEAGASD